MSLATLKQRFFKKTAEEQAARNVTDGEERRQIVRNFAKGIEPDIETIRRLWPGVVGELPQCSTCAGSLKVSRRTVGGGGPTKILICERLHETRLRGEMSLDESSFQQFQNAIEERQACVRELKKMRDSIEGSADMRKLKAESDKLCAAMAKAKSKLDDFNKSDEGRRFLSWSSGTDGWGLSFEMKTIAADGKAICEQFEKRQTTDESGRKMIALADQFEAWIEGDVADGEVVSVSNDMLADCRAAEKRLVARLTARPADAKQTVANLIRMREMISVDTGKSVPQIGVNIVGAEPFSGCSTACGVLMARLPEIGTINIVSSADFSESELRLTSMPAGGWIACSGPNLTIHLSVLKPDAFSAGGVTVAFNIAHPGTSQLNLATGMGVMIHELSHALGAHEHDALFVMTCCLIHHRAKLHKTVPISSIHVGYGATECEETLFACYAEALDICRGLGGIPIREVIRQYQTGARRLPQSFRTTSRRLTHA